MYARPAATTLSSLVIPQQLLSVMSESSLLPDIMAQLKQNTCVFWVSNGEWSMHQMLMAILDKTGSAKLWLSTYAMSEKPARIIAQLKDEKVITELNVVLDNRVDVRTAGSLQIIKTIADKYGLVDTHAKVSVVRNDDFDIAVVGSANYTENSRWEAGVIIWDKTICDQHIVWIEKALANGIQ